MAVSWSTDVLPQQRSAAIIGAGIGGMTAALALLQRGWRVRIHEQAAVLAEVGAGISISPGAAAGLASLGLGRALERASLPVARLAFVHYRTGEVLSSNHGHSPDSGESPDSGRPMRDPGLTVARHIHRADLQAMLLDAVLAIDAQALVLGRRLTGFEQGSHVVAHFADGSFDQADVLIAADGVRSVARRELFGDGAPLFARQVAFRCLVPRAEAQPFLRAGNAVVSIGAGRIFHRYLIRGGSLLNVIGIAQSDAWPHESWNTPASVAEFLALYRDFHADVTGLIERAAGPTLIKWGLIVRPPLARWSVGRVGLLGDAAHPILPFLGLGAALAVEDAIVIARALDEVPQLETALECYQATRQPRVEGVRVASIRQGEIIQTAEVTRQSLAQAPAKDDALFDFDPCRAPLQHSAGAGTGHWH
jgi:salicylate hydroxylase